MGIESGCLWVCVRMPKRNWRTLLEPVRFQDRHLESTNRDCVPEPKILIAIINHNTREELRVCLESLRGSSARLVVFDNGSSDGSAAMVRCEHAGVLVIENQQNLGYGAAANRVFLDTELAQDAEFLLVSNSDVIFPPNAVCCLIEDLVRHPEAAAAGPRLVNPGGSLQRSCFAFPGALRWVFDNDAVCTFLRFLPGLRGALLRLWLHDQERPIPWVKGAVMAVRRTAFEQAGGFDESFFMYYEDADLCYRLGRLGWLTRFTPRAEVIHHGGASTKKARPAMTIQLYVSSMRFARHHYSPYHFTVLFWLWKAVLCIRLLRDWMRLTWMADGDRRESIQQDLRAWRSALLWGFDRVELQELCSHL